MLPRERCRTCSLLLSTCDASRRTEMPSTDITWMQRSAGQQYTRAKCRTKADLVWCEIANHSQRIACRGRNPAAGVSADVATDVQRKVTHPLPLMCDRNVRASEKAGVDMCSTRARFALPGPSPGVRSGAACAGGQPG